LTDRDKSKLVDMLMEQAMEDGRLRQRLTLEVARSGAKGIDLRTYRRAIDVAVDVGDFVDYEGAFDYAHGIEEAVKGIEELLRAGHAAEAIELSEYALERVEGAIEHVDDSGGHMGGILEQLQTLHLTACKQARPDPVALAKRLFAWELRTSWDTFYGAAATYADVLGQKGLATYRELAEAEWARVPSRGPADALRPESCRYSRITHIMEILAEQAGDVYREIGDAAAAEAPYRYALEMAPADRPRYDRDGAVERLICILDSVTGVRSLRVGREPGHHGP
jgi:tetratricopeptide (TPR) repeat protein